MNDSAASTRLLILLIGLASLGVGACTGVNDFASDDGTFPERWVAGLDCTNASPFQVHAYDEDFYVIRQSMCLNYEAPFLFLFIGGERALLMDTGAVPDADVYGTVMDILERRADEVGSRPVPLVVAHTHSHGDHRSADAQFLDAAGVGTLVGLSVDEVMDFWDFTDWPNDTPTFDLGDRVFDVIAIPGHHSTSIALYDRRTRVLLTGDSVYPGHLFIPSAEAWPVVGASLERLVAFAETHSVSWVLGNHIEVSSQPHEPYVYRTVPHDDERVLHFLPSKLPEITGAVRAMGDAPTCEIYEDFVIHPTYLCAGDWNG
jgi:glyoxylase-like metal-dependent hydrolase (beta-lactamase superfamily II)